MKCNCVLVLEKKQYVEKVKGEISCQLNFVSDKLNANLNWSV